jgi:hypothetical protein
VCILARKGGWCAERRTSNGQGRTSYGQYWHQSAGENYNELFGPRCSSQTLWSDYGQYRHQRAKEKSVTNADLWKQYAGYTSTLSKIGRKLAYGAAAVAWILKDPQSHFSRAVLASLAFTIGFFVFDILQQYLAALVLRSWIQKEEVKKLIESNSIEGKYDKPRWLDAPAFWCAQFKVYCLLISYFFLFFEIYNRWGKQ